MEEERTNNSNVDNANFKKDKHHNKNNELEKKLKNLESENKSLSEKIEQLKKEIEDNKKLASQYLNTASYYKSQADSNKKDFERFKERNKDIEKNANKKANESTAKLILPVIDDFDQAISQVDNEIMKGFAMIYSSLINILSDLGVVEIKCNHDELDPELHNCITTEQTDDESLDGHIATIFKKGYKFIESNEVIRPATVSVYKINL